MDYLSLYLSPQTLNPKDLQNQTYLHKSKTLELSIQYENSEILMVLSSAAFSHQGYKVDRISNQKRSQLT